MTKTQKLQRLADVSGLNFKIEYSKKNVQWQGYNYAHCWIVRTDTLNPQNKKVGSFEDVEHYLKQCNI